MKKLLTFILVLGSLVGSAQNTIWNFPAYSGSMTGVRFAVGVGANSTRYVLWDNLGFALSGHTHAFSSLTSKPTTLSGYGITDAYTKAQVDAAFAPLSHTHGMADLTGFNIVSPINGSVLKYNSGTGKWEVGSDNTGGSPVWGTITGTLSSQTDLNTALSGKQATLVSGTNIKTVNGNSLLGSGDVVISSGSSFPTQQSHTSGTAVTVSNQSTNIWLQVNPASVIASLTITFPAAPVDGQRMDISFGGTMTTGTVVTSLSLAGNGKTILQASTPSTAQAGENIAYMYKSSNTTWYRIN